MTLVRWDPFRELEDMSDRLNRMISRPALPRTNGKETMVVADWVPSVDVSETDGEYQIKAEIPDVKKEDVKVTVEKGTMTIVAHRKFESEEKDKKPQRIEPICGSFGRTFSLPDDASPGNVSAEFKDGVLVVHLAKGQKAGPQQAAVMVS